jgi:hypothetical protein
MTELVCSLYQYVEWRTLEIDTQNHGTPPKYDL